MILGEVRERKKSSFQKTLTYIGLDAASKKNRTKLVNYTCGA